MEINGFFCIDSLCPKRFCWTPGNYESRSTTGSGSINTGKFIKTCMKNAHHGCPDPLPHPKETRDEWLKRKI